MSDLLQSDHGGLRSGWKVIGFALLYLALTVLLALGAEVVGNRHGLSPWVGALLGALTSYLCVRMEGVTFSSLGFRPGARWLLDCLAGALGGLVIILLTALVVRGLGGFHWERHYGIGYQRLLINLWPLLGVAFNEEILCRGYPFQRFMEGAGPWTGQVVFAALFALMHWGNPGMHGATRAWATLNIGLSAILFGLCYLRTRSLAMPIGLHLGWNWAQGSLLGFGVSGYAEFKGPWMPVFHGRPEWLTGGAFGLEASLPCALVCGLAILAVWRWKGRGTGEPTAGASTASAS